VQNLIVGYLIGVSYWNNPVTVQRLSVERERFLVAVANDSERS